MIPFISGDSSRLRLPFSFHWFNILDPDLSNTIAELAEIKKKISGLQGEISDLKIERKKEGISEAERLSIGQEITALTNEKVEIMKAAPGIVHDHM
jgi:uncharacterized protein (DUF3084 family)